MLRAIALTLLAGSALSVPALADNRTFDGSNNHQVNTAWGQTGTDLIRGISGAHYADGLGAPRVGPNPRAISNALSAQTPGGLGNARNLSSMTWQWGQFIDHDFALVDESAEAMDIPVPPGDLHLPPGSVIPFNRSAHTGGAVGPREHQNALTHWLDASMVYGSDGTRAAALREPGTGRLATSAGDLLPYNTGGLPNAGGTGSNLFVAGDIRSNEQTGLTAMHTLFVREHNRLADQIALANPGMSADDVYQRARKMVGAEVQAITYNEWLPAMLGSHGLGAYSGYNDSVDPSLNTAFSTGAFRIGHTMLNDQLLRYNSDGTEYAGGHLNLFQAFFNPSTITDPGALEAVIRGLGRQQSNEVDLQAIDAVRNLLFGGPNGRDLIAINIQRGRDHGLPDYNTLRLDVGLSPVVSFNDITSDAGIAAALASVFGDVNNIDPWIGMFAEDHLSGASMGETAAAVLNDQFGRLRDCDRYFYLNDPDLTQSDLAFLNSLKLSDIIRWNTDADDVQDHIFFAIPTPGSLAMFGIGAMGFVRRRRRA